MTLVVCISACPSETKVKVEPGLKQSQEPSSASEVAKEKGTATFLHLEFKEWL